MTWPVGLNDDVLERLINEAKFILGELQAQRRHDAAKLLEDQIKESLENGDVCLHKLARGPSTNSSMQA